MNNKSTKILEIVPTLLHGGAERIVIDLSIQLSKENDVIVLCLYNEDKSLPCLIEELRKKGIKVVFLNKKKGIDLKTAKALRKIIKKINPDVIHLHLNTLLTFYLAFIGRRKRNGVFYTIHNIPREDAEGLLFCLYKRLFKKHIIIPIGISKIITNLAIKDYNLKRVDCVYNGIDFNHYFCNKPLFERDKTIVSIANFKEAKNQTLLVKMAPYLTKDYKIEMYGEGVLKSQIENEIHSLSMEKTVFLLGSADNVNEILKKTQIFVLPSLYEGNPLSLLEAMAAGNIVIAAKVGGIPDVITDGVNGFILNKATPQEYAKLINSIVNNIERFEIMKNKAIETVKEYDISIMAKNYLNVFKNN